MFVRSASESRRAYNAEGGCTQAGTTIKPVIVAQFVDLDSFLVRRRMRHRLCRHRQRCVRFGVGDQTIILQEVGCEV